MPKIIRVKKTVKNYTIEMIRGNSNITGKFLTMKNWLLTTKGSQLQRTRSDQTFSKAPWSSLAGYC